jgi:hypothetical protein
MDFSDEKVACPGGALLFIWTMLIPALRKSANGRYGQVFMPIT